VKAVHCPCGESSRPRRMTSWSRRRNSTFEKTTPSSRVSTRGRRFSQSHTTTDGCRYGRNRALHSREAGAVEEPVAKVTASLERASSRWTG
jgi:hypothetical protein